MGDKADRYIHSELFNLSTTMRADYRKYTADPDVKAEYKIKVKKPEVRPAPPLLNDTATMTARRVQIPFDLFWKTKEILRDDPRVPQEPHVPLGDPEREEVQKTRPRVTLGTAAIIDDLEEPSRQQLVKDIYTSTYTYTMREPAARAANNLNVRAPLPQKAASSVAVRLRHPVQPYILPAGCSLPPCSAAILAKVLCPLSREAL